MGNGKAIPGTGKRPAPGNSGFPRSNGSGSRPNIGNRKLPSSNELSDFLGMPGGSVRPGNGSGNVANRLPGNNNVSGFKDNIADRRGSGGRNDKVGDLKNNIGDRRDIANRREKAGNIKENVGDRRDVAKRKDKVGDIKDNIGDGNRDLGDRVGNRNGDININAGNSINVNRQNNINSMRNRWNNVGINNRPFNQNWWGRHPINRPGWGWHAGWGRYSASWYWRPCTWAGFGTWFAWSWSQPVTYSYGTNVVYRDNYVYINDQQVASSADYYQQAETVAAGIPDNVVADEIEWMPLGVFAIAEENATDSGMLLQLAVSKEGILAGTFYNELADISRPVEGTVDRDTQRAAWRFADGKNPEIVMETAIYNLTQDESTALTHFGPDQQENWLLVRLPESTEDGN